MPHTHAAKLRAPKEASGYQVLLQIHDSSTDSEGNDYLDWNLPELPYQQDCSEDISVPGLSWFANEMAVTDRTQSGADAQLPNINTVGDVLDERCGPNSSTDFCGLQNWYSRAPLDFSSECSAAIAQPKLSDSINSPYSSASLSVGSQSVDQTCGTQPWSPKTSFQPSTLSDGIYIREKSDTQAVDLTEALEDPSSSSSLRENDRISTAKTKANKKRKIAHRLVEKNYRSRIKKGMAELKCCVPSTPKSRSVTDSGLPEGQPFTEDATQNRSSGKAAILSDAVWYVKALTYRNEALHGKLDVLQRRNNSLQKIALSKVNMNKPVTKKSTEGNNQEGVEGHRGGKL